MNPAMTVKIIKNKKIANKYLPNKNDRKSNHRMIMMKPQKLIKLFQKNLVIKKMKKKYQKNNYQN